MRIFGRTLLVAALGAATVASTVVSPAPASAHEGTTRFGRTIVSAGVDHTCAVDADATAWCWGYDGSGQVTGTPSATLRTTPVKVPDLPAGTVLAVSAGSNHSCALMNDGGVECWGANGLGQLGNGAVSSSDGPLPVAGLTDAVAVSAGDGTTCALRADGRIRCWGFGNRGQRGDGTTTPTVAEPVDVVGITTATDVSVGGSFACARLAGGHVRCWGQGGQGQLGNGGTADSSVPVEVTGLTDATSVSAGSGHVCAAGTPAVCWGMGSLGALGDGTTNDSSVPVAVQFSPSLQVVSVGHHFTCGVGSTGLLCWGGNLFGQLGVGNTTSSSSPVGVAGTAGAFQLTTGLGHVCLGSTTLRCWGAGGNGQLGDGATSNLDRPPAQAIAGLSLAPGIAEPSTVAPERLLDTRPDTRIGYVGAKPAAGETVTVQVTGSGQAQLPAGTPAAMLNVTGTEATAAGFVTVWPCDEPRPLASSLNLVPGQDRANLVLVRLSATGTACLYTQSGTHLVADLDGHVPATTAYVAVQPDRVLDTRPEFTIGYGGPKPGVGSTVELQVAGTAENQAPPGTSTVVLNVTATEATNPGYVTVWPCDEARPTASNLNVARGDTLAVGVIAKVSATGTVCLFSQSGTHLVADLDGYLPPGGTYRPIAPVRVLDTRPASLTGYSGGKPLADDVVTVALAPVPELDTVKARSVVLSVTATEADADAFVTVWSCSGPRPLASNLNVPAGGSRANLVITGSNSASTVCLSANRSTHLVVDVNGWMPASATTTIERA